MLRPLVALLVLLLVKGSAVAAPSAVPTASFDWFEYTGSDPIDGAARPKPGEYRNPILQGFYPDPSVTRVGRDFYLVNSTFAWFPGIPVFYSRDLVHWTQIGNAIDRPGQLDFARLDLTLGVFAPTIQAKDGLFYLLNTCVGCGGNFVMTARNPAGPWSDPAWLPDLEGGIDPSLFFDSDGSSWVVNNGAPEGKPLYEGHRAIWLQQFDLKTRKTFGARTQLVSGGADISRKPIWIEGPHILKKGDFYYLICAEGGTSEGHSEVVFRSRAIKGPYTPFSGNPILTQRDLAGDRPFPITSAGHAQLVDTPDGRWWTTFLAVRPYRGDYYNTGRETFLLPVKWKDDWPRVTTPGQAIPYTHAVPGLAKGAAPPVPTSGPFTVRDEFDRSTLPPYWMMMRNPHERWYGIEGGSLRLQARPVGLGDNANPSFLARRQQHIDATASTAMRFEPSADGDEAGLVALQNDQHWFFLGSVRRNGRTAIELRRRVGNAETIVASAPVAVGPGAPLRLKIVARGADYDFYYAVHGAWQTLKLKEDGTILSTKTAGGFVGSMFGLYARSAAAKP